MPARVATKRSGVRISVLLRGGVDSWVAEATAERERTDAAVGALDEVEAGKHVERIVEQRLDLERIVGASVPARAVAIDELAQGAAEDLAGKGRGAPGGEDVAEEE